jgi:trehalose/maltose hydrolase-like predicted phosphorylase
MSEWLLAYDDWDPAREPLREALCTLGNGYVATRGAAAERGAGGAHYPGTYLAGGYDRLPTLVDGHLVENEDLVNWPNWLSLTFRADDGDWLDADRWTLLEWRWTLDLQRGVLVRRLRVRDPDGRVTSLRGRRLVHMGDRHLAALEWELTPENWSGVVTVRSALDGTVTNAGVARYGALDGRHLQPIAARAGADGVLELLVESAQSRLRVAQAARTRLFVGGRECAVTREATERTGYVAEEVRVRLGPGRPLHVEKVVAIVTSRDHAIAEPRLEAARLVRRAPDFPELLRTHALAWKRLWRRCDIGLVGAPRAQVVLRLHVFHLLQTVSPHSIDLDAGVPARGWHGEAYRGHVFWDELFVFPFLNLRVPEITRALLMYRFRRLGEARLRARAAGHAGALFPWQSGSSGREESQVVHLNPRSGRWVRDHTQLQYHVSSAVAYNVWQYYQATGDVEFLSFYGATLVLEVARFWASLAVHDPADDRYHIRGVMGPDEFHDAYPGADRPGIDDNAYTNVMAAWVLDRAEAVLAALPADRREELLDELEITEHELARWRAVGSRLALHFHDGVLSQFAGYHELAELDWAAYRDEYGDIQRLDRILEAEGDTPNNYRASKQADVLMLFYLLSAPELARVMERLGYAWDPSAIPRTVQYYLDRTAHGSTLSGVVHAWVLARTDRRRSWELFVQALESDVSDVQGGTTAEGIHLGAMAGTVDMVQRCYLGLEMRDDALHLDPLLPDALDEVRVTLHYRGQTLRVRAARDAVTVAFAHGTAERARVSVRGELVELRAGEERRFVLAPEGEQEAAVA